MLDKSAPQSSTRTSGPLAGFRIVEFAGIGPGPFACMMLADMGAEVVTLDRVGAKKNLKSVAGRGRKVVELDLKDKAAIAQVLDLLGQCRRADRRLSARRDGAAGARARRGAGAQPAPGLWPHDRMGPGRPAGAGRRPRHQLHLGDRRAGRDRRARTSRCRRSTWSAISAAARSISWSACSRRCWRRRNPARDRWWMPRCATARRR